MEPVMRYAMLLLLIVFGLAGCSSRLPHIDDPARLVKECSALSALPDGPVEAERWPATVKELRPLEVRETGGCTLIKTYVETGSGVRGYLVAEKPPSPMAQYQIVPTEFPGIYRFEFQP